MSRIGVSVQKTHRNRFDLRSLERFGQDRNFGGIERYENLARRVHPFGKLEGKLARHQWSRSVKKKIECIRTIAAADGVDIAHAPCGHKCGRGAFAFQNGIDGDGRAMEKFIHCGKTATRQPKCIGDPLRGIGGNSQCLRGDDRVVAIGHEIGKGAADVDPDDAHPSSPVQIPLACMQ